MRVSPRIAACFVLRFGVVYAGVLGACGGCPSSLDASVAENGGDFTVRDALTLDLVEEPQFKIPTGVALAPTCASFIGHTCQTWIVRAFGGGDIIVSAAGYVSKTITASGRWQSTSESSTCPSAELVFPAVTVSLERVQLDANVPKDGAGLADANGDS